MNENPVDTFDKQTEYIVVAYTYFERRLRELCAARTGISGPMDAAEARKIIKHHASVKLPGDKLWHELMMLKKITHVLRENAGKVGEHALLYYCRKIGIADEAGGAKRVRVTEEYKTLVQRMMIEFFNGLEPTN